jgi:ammonia channel protein AmtB
MTADVDGLAGEANTIRVGLLSSSARRGGCPPLLAKPMRQSIRIKSALIILAWLAVFGAAISLLVSKVMGIRLRGHLDDSSITYESGQ